MQERQVTVGGTRHKLPDPFFVLATQNPIEQEGTYPLPEAQQDRFMFNVVVDYPEEEEEFKIVEMTTSLHTPKIERVLSANDILEMQDIVRKVPVGALPVIRYAMKFTRLTRKEKGEVPDFIRDFVTWGAGPRATQNLVLGAKARAVLHGRYYVSCEDIRAVAIPVLRHRIITNFNAEAEGIKPENIVRRLAEIIPRDPNEEEAAASAPPAAVVTKIIESPACGARANVAEPRYAASGKIQNAIRRPQSLSRSSDPRYRCAAWNSRLRLIVEGYLSGMHKSPYHGFSVEFAEHREYVPGDDIKHIDWKVYGRTGKFFPSQAIRREETNLIYAPGSCWTSAESMHYGSREGMTKYDYAFHRRRGPGVSRAPPGRQRRLRDLRFPRCAPS